MGVRIKSFKDWFPAGSFGCFYCGVDSKPILYFFIALMGSLVLATVCTGVGFWLKGFFRDENTKNAVFEAEERK